MLAKSPWRIAVDALRTTKMKQYHGSLIGGPDLVCAVAVILMAFGCKVTVGQIRDPNGDWIESYPYWLASRMGVHPSLIHSIIQRNDVMRWSFAKIADALEAQCTRADNLANIHVLNEPRRRMVEWRGWKNFDPKIGCEVAEDQSAKIVETSPA